MGFMTTGGDDARSEGMFGINLRGSRKVNDNENKK